MPEALDVVGPAKTCTLCGVMRSASEYSPKHPEKDGLHSHCKPCRAAWARNYRKTERYGLYAHAYNRRPEVMERYRQWHRNRVVEKAETEEARAILIARKILPEQTIGE